MIGHNDQIAWGFTTTGGDVEDLFIEKIDPDDPGRYLTPDGRAAVCHPQETIAVRGADPIVLTVRSTRHGPVLSDGLPAGSVEPGYVLALQATFLDRRRPHRPRRSGTSTAPPIGTDFATRSRIRRAAAEHRLCRYRRGRSALSLRPASRCARTAMAGCRCPAGPATTTGPALFRSPSCRKRTTRRRPLRQRQQQDRARHLSVFPIARLGHPRIAPNGSRNCSQRRRGNRWLRAPQSRPTRYRSRLAGWCR